MHIISAILLLISMSGCIIWIAAHYGYVLLIAWHHWTFVWFLRLSPWTLLILAPLCWRKTVQWRRLEAGKSRMIQLSRGHYMPLPAFYYRRSFAERFCQYGFLLAMVTLPYASRASQPEWIVAIILLCWGFLMFSVRALFHVR